MTVHDYFPLSKHSCFSRIYAPYREETSDSHSLKKDCYLSSSFPLVGFSPSFGSGFSSLYSVGAQETFSNPSSQGAFAFAVQSGFILGENTPKKDALVDPWMDTFISEISQDLGSPGHYANARLFFLSFFPLLTFPHFSHYPNLQNYGRDILESLF